MSELPFIRARRCRPSEHDRSSNRRRGEETASLFEHCRRGLEGSLGWASTDCP